MPLQAYQHYPYVVNYIPFKNKHMKNLFTFLMLLSLVYSNAQELPSPVISFSFENGNVSSDNGADFALIGSDTNVFEHEYFGNVLELETKLTGLSIGGDLVNDTNFTVSVWVNDSNNTWWNRYICVGGNDGSGTRSYGIGKKQNNNAQLFGDVHSNWNTRFESSGLDLDSYEWFQISVVYEKPTFTFYVNGEPQGSLITDVPMVTVDSIFFGLHANHNFTFNENNSLKGFIDGIYVFDTTLSDANVAQLYAETLGGIQLTNKQAAYKIGDSIEVSVLPEQITVEDIEYTSLDESVVSVDGAKLTALKGDTVNIIGKWVDNNEVLDTFEVIVLADTIITISSPSLTLANGDSLQLEASIAPDFAVTYEWSVASMGGTATIDQNGKLKASGIGDVQVKVNKQNSLVSDSIILKILGYGENLLFASYDFEIDGSDAIGNADLQFFNNASIVNDDERGNVVHITEADTGFMAATAPLIYSQDSFTFATWYYYDQANVDKDYQWNTIFEFNRSSDKSIHYYLCPRLWTDQYGFVSNGGKVGGSWVNVSSKPHFPTNTWYHIAVTQKDDLVTIYLNGNQYVQKSVGVSPSAFEVDTFFIGTNPLRESKPMNAKFDDLKFFHKSLSAEEIAEIAGTIKPMELAINEDSVEINDSPILTTSILPENATNKAVTWSVSNLSGEASIDENTGKITPVQTGYVRVTATTVLGEITEDAIIEIYENPNDISNAYADNGIRIYPNPSSTVFNIKLNGNTSNTLIKVIDIAGNEILTKNINKTQRIQLHTSDFNSKGVFFIVFENNNRTITRKLIIE